MFYYDKKLQYPVKIAKPNPRLASIILSQYGRMESWAHPYAIYAMPFDELKGLLTDIGT